jgi:hypothetical protein
MRFFALAFLLMLASCGTPPEPVIQTKIVEKAVPVPCKKPDLGPRPLLQGKDEIAKALAAAPTFDDRLKIVTEQLLLYVGWTPKVEAGLDGCTSVPNAETP